MELYENEQKQETAVLVSVDTGEFDVESSLLELAELTKTAGAEVIGEITQKREAPDSATYIGKGKLEELSEFCEMNQPDLIIVDGELVSEDGRDLTILRAIARAKRWQKLLDDGVFKTTSEIAEVLQTDQSYVARTIRLAYLAPRIVRLFLEDKAPPRLSLAKMMKAFPEDWNEQYIHFGIEPADS